MQLAKLKNSIVIAVIVIKILIILLLGLLFAATSYAKADLVNIMSITLPILLIAFFIFMKGTPSNWQGKPQEKSSFLLFLSLLVLVIYMISVVALMLYRHDVGAEASSKAILGIGVAEIFLVIYLVYIFIILRRKN